MGLEKPPTPPTWGPGPAQDREQEMEMLLAQHKDLDWDGAPFQNAGGGRGADKNHAWDTRVLPPFHEGSDCKRETYPSPLNPFNSLPDPDDRGRRSGWVCPHGWAAPKVGGPRPQFLHW